MGQLAALIRGFIVFGHKSAACLYNDRVKQQKDRGKRQDYCRHTDQRASCHQHAERGNDGNPRIHSNAESRCEERHRADENALDRSLVRDQHCFALILAGRSLHLISARHEDRVIDCGSQLDRSDDDRGNEGKRRPCIKGKSHIDEDRALNDQHQKDRQAQRHKHDHNDRSYDPDRGPVDDIEVVVGNGDQVFGTGRVADQHRTVVVSVDNLIDRIDLRVHFVGRRDIFTGHQHQLISAAIQNVRRFLREDLPGNPLSHKAVHGNDAFDARHVLDLLRHFIAGLRVQIRVRENHQRVVHTERVFHSLVGHHGRQILWQSLDDVIVDIVMSISVDCGNPRENK